MIRDITIGQYYKADSVIHRLDPRVKLMGTLIFIISLFMGMNIWIYAVVTVALAVVIKMSRIPLKFMVRGLKSIVILIIISAVFNLFLTPGDVLIQIWKLTITYQGLKMAIFMVVRLIYLIVGTSLMTLTTTPNNLTDGFRDRGKGYGHSFNGIKGLLRIDFISYDKSFTGLVYDSPHLPWSDHNPIIMKVKLKTTSR